MKNLSDIILEKLNLGKAKFSNAATDLESFAHNHNVQFRHYKEGKRIHDYIIKINCNKILKQNKADVEHFIDNWFYDSEYKNQYNIKRSFFKLKSNPHIYVQIISNTDIILSSITIYDNGIQTCYVDNIDEDISEMTYMLLDDIVTEFAKGKKQK